MIRGIDMGREVRYTVPTVKEIHQREYEMSQYTSSKARGMYLETPSGKTVGMATYRSIGCGILVNLDQISERTVSIETAEKMGFPPDEIEKACHAAMGHVW